MSAPEVVTDVGEIAILKDECFWMIPERYVNSPKFYVCSPLFSYLGEKWRFGISCSKDGMVKLFLRRKFYRDLPSDCHYTVRAVLEDLYGEDVADCGGVLEYDYGFESSEFTHRKEFTCDRVAHLGQIRISFVIKKKSVGDDSSKISDENKNEDNRSSEVDQSTKDETSSEDERSFDKENEDKKNAISKSKGIKKLAENIKQIFLDGRMSDAVLKVDGRDFKVHKAILVARSPVFESMFQHDLAEKKNNVVDIPDCTAESFEVFLHHLYSGQSEGISDSNVYNVYYAADKYHVDDLKQKCLKFLVTNISVESFCDVIALSLRHGESKLQKVATRFFCENVRKIIKTVQWQKYLEENSCQANELLIKALNA